MGWCCVSICILFAVLVTVSQQAKPHWSGSSPGEIRYDDDEQTGYCPPRFKDDGSSRCYFTSTRKDRYSGAWDVCAYLGSSLPIIKNKDDEVFISNLSPDRVFWLGMKLPEHSDDWTWNNGEVVNESNWIGGDPGIPYGQCAAMTVETGRPWRNTRCDDAEYFVCTHEYVKTTTAEPVTTTTTEPITTTTTEPVTTTDYETTTSETSQFEDEYPEMCAGLKKDGYLASFCSTRRGFKKCKKSCTDRKNDPITTPSSQVGTDSEKCEALKVAGGIRKFCKRPAGKKQCPEICNALQIGQTTTDANPELCQQKKDDGKFNKYFCKKDGKKLCKLSCSALKAA